MKRVLIKALCNIWEQIPLHYPYLCYIEWINYVFNKPS